MANILGILKANLPKKLKTSLSLQNILLILILLLIFFGFYYSSTKFQYRVDDMINSFQTIGVSYKDSSNITSYTCPNDWIFPSDREYVRKTYVYRFGIPFGYKYKGAFNYGGLLCPCKDKTDEICKKLIY